MEIKKLFFLSLAVLSLNIFGQTAASNLYYYPHDQQPYQGGDVQFYRDFHQILVENNIKPCENKDEIYYLRVLINEDASVKYVKDDTNKELAEKNKCTYDLGYQVIKHMDKWNPATIDGVKKQAVAGFIIKPNDLFGNDEENYAPKEEPALFENRSDGINRFRSEVVKKIDLNGFQWKEGFKLVMMFVIDTDGTISDIKFEQSSGVPEFDARIVKGIKSIKKKWKPATIGGIPVKYRFRLPLAFNASK